MGGLMNTIFERFKCLFVLGVGVFSFISCATLPEHISMPNKLNVSGTTAKFENCKMSVRFSGPPRPFSTNELNEFKNLPKFFNWELEGLVFEEHLLAEFAICTCRDLEYSLEEIQQNESQFQLNKEFRFIKGYDSPYFKKVIEFESSNVPGIPDKIVARYKVIFPNAAPKCSFIQFVISDPATSSKSTKFFETLASQTNETTPQPEGNPSALPQSKPSVAERLEELNNLLKRNLITKEEYEQKRKAILEGL
jgi:hypothetical protein